jgi:predicted DCC family thiol-disulfide oxidoreductase YuxK
MDTVIYDGECRFCIEKVRAFKNADTEHTLEFIPRQDPDAEKRFPEIIGVPLDDGIIVVDEQRNLHVAADGIYRMAMHFPSLKWRLFSGMYRLPVFKQATQLCYRVIAANRRRLGKTCVDNVCSLDDAKR